MTLLQNMDMKGKTFRLESPKPIRSNLSNNFARSLPGSHRGFRYFYAHSPMTRSFILGAFFISGSLNTSGDDPPADILLEGKFFLFWS
jgi:hypothetical protein